MCCYIKYVLTITIISLSFQRYNVFLSRSNQTIIINNALIYMNFRIIMVILSNKLLFLY